MKIIVCMKFINSIQEYHLTPLPFSPSDLDALGMALHLKEKLNHTSVSVLSMGPKSALDALQDLYSYGVDNIYLCSDGCFAGSDTLATTFVLARAVQKIQNLNSIQVILCGKNTIDSNTGQVGPGLAWRLQAEYYDSLKQINITETNMILVTDRFIFSQASGDLVGTVDQKYPLPFPTIKDIQKAKNKAIIIWDHEILNIEKAMVGLSGSPTKIVKTDIKYPSVKKKMIVEGTLQEQTIFLKELIKRKGN